MPLARSLVFVDSSAFVALIRRDDRHHADATTILERLRQQRARLYTTNYVVAETHALLLRYLGYAVARAFLQEAGRGRSAVVLRAEENDEAAARAIIYRFTDKEFSFADAISFAVMARMGISQAFAFDRHFAQYGVEVLAVSD